MVVHRSFSAEQDAPPAGLGAVALGGGVLHEFRAPAGCFLHASCVVLLLAGGAGPVLWVSTAQTAYPPGIAWLGLDPGRILFAQGRDDAECLGSLEVALRGGMAGIAEVVEVSRLAARRLALAARQGGAVGFLVRHAPRVTARDSTSVATRWFVEPAGGGRIKAELLYAKAGQPDVFLYEIREGSDDGAPPALGLVSPDGERLRAAG